MLVCVCVFLAAQAEATRPASHFFDWQATAVLSERVCVHADTHMWHCGIYMNMASYALSVFSLCVFTVLFLTHICLSMRLLISRSLHPCLDLITTHL